MNIFGFEISRKSAKAHGATMSLDEFIRRMEAVHETVSGITVTPETAMQSPTVHAIVTAVSRRFAACPPHIYQKITESGRTRKEPMPNHPVARLLRTPNDYQDRVSYWLDAASWLVRYGNHYAVKARGQTGPIRRLIAVPASHIEVKQEDDLSLTYAATLASGQRQEFTSAQMHHARGPARNGYKGDSPVMDAREAIALEIAAERFGASFFGNGAMPWMVFKYVQGFQGHRNPEERQQFVEDFHEAFGRGKRFRAMFMPNGVEMADPIQADNDKHQYLETRKLQRSIIAGAFGVPPRFVGDLEQAHFNNVEQQSLDFVQTVILPYARIFEAAMERDLLTPEDRNNGVVIRFNLDGALRGDFKSRQEGLKIQREMGVISSNEWREEEGRNPLPEGQGGDDVWQTGPSGQGGPERQASPEGDNDADT